MSDPRKLAKALSTDTETAEAILWLFGTSPKAGTDCIECADAPAVIDGAYCSDCFDAVHGQFGVGA